MNLGENFISLFTSLREFYREMYIIKIRGKVKIPDYIQIRDDQFTLLAYFRADRPDDALRKIGLTEKAEEIRKIIAELAFGKMTKLELK